LHSAFLKYPQLYYVLILTFKLDMPFFLLSIVESGVCALDERHANSISLYRDFMIESLASASLAA
jgi:hypothetical protein